MKIETIAIHAGRGIDPATGAVSLPLHTSTTFERAPDGDFPAGFAYVRNANPNRDAFETCIAALEGGGEAVAFASGMAAIAAVMETCGDTRPGRIVVPHEMYFNVRTLIDQTDLGKRFTFTATDMTDLDGLRAVLASGQTSMVWVETPSNPLISVVDMAAVSEIAHAAGAIVGVDNTWGTPVLQRPFDCGADVVVHSATKYIGGHSDLMLGVVVLREGSDLVSPLRSNQRIKGSVPSPFDCWLALRGVQSLPVRMAAHCAGAMTVATALSAHAGVEKVLYPGLPQDPGHAIASRQMRGFGGMLSFILPGGAEAAFRMTAALRLVIRATSLGGAHTLIEHRASIEGPGTTAPPGLLRLSVGLEHPDDIIADLTGAIEIARSA